MKKTLERLKKISETSSQITLYPAADIQTIIRSTSKLPGDFDKDLFEFYKYANGASIFDYCIAGCKNKKLGISIDSFGIDLWEANDFLAGNFISFMTTSTGQTFGFLCGIENSRRTYPIAYLEDINDESLLVISSSFSSFLKTFIEDVELTLEKSKEEDFILEIEMDDWPTNLNRWLSVDLELKNMYSKKLFHDFISSKTIRELSG